MTTYPVANAPHIRSTDSIARYFWMKNAALFPILAAAVWTGGFDFIRILALSVGGSLGFEWLSRGFSRKKTTLLNGDTFLTGLTLALLLPERSSLPHVLIAVFMAVVVVRECFGGTGNYIVHPAIFGRVFLDAVFPVSAGSPVLFRCAAEPLMLTAIVLSAVCFLAQRRIYFETPFYYITIYLLAAFMLGGGSKALTHAGVAVFTAFFLVTDPVVLPLTRQGTNVFVLLAAFFAGIFGLWYPAVTAVGYAILIVNMLVPWINDRMRPDSRRGV